MLLSAQSIRKAKIIEPFHERTEFHGMTYGLGPHGYDIRIRENLVLGNGSFRLASSIEHFNMPTNIMGQVCDKSSLARRGLFVQNTIIEAGWRGYLTLELTFEGNEIHVGAGTPIAQIIFMQLDEPTEQPYNGKYQDQPAGPQKAK